MKSYLDFEEKLNPNNYKFFIFLSFFLLSLISYLYALNGDFVGDDIGRVLNNAELFSLKSSLTGELSDRPVLMLSMWIDNFLFHLNPIIMRVENLLIHSFVGLQMYYFINEFKERITNKNNYLVNYLICCLFILHPLHSQTIYIVIQRGVLLSSLFGIISLRFFIKYASDAKLTNFLISILSFIIAITSKPIIIFLPFGLVIFQKLVNKDKLKNSIFVYFLYFISLLIPVYYYFHLKLNNQLSSSTPSPISYFLTETQVIFTYF